KSQLGLQLQLDCSSQGIVFVEASSTSTLRTLNYFDDVASIPFHHLLPEPEPEPLVQMQITQFACGGFVMGLIFCHSICDGLGAAQFLNAVGELARGKGLDPLSVTPAWHRDFFHPNPNAPLPKQVPPPAPLPEYSLLHSNIDIPIQHINRLKKQFQESTGNTCSAFEIVAASFWRCRTRAIYDYQYHQDQGDGSGEKIKLVFFANCRELVDPPLPKGFYGNCFFPVTISGWSRGIGEASINEVVKLIQEAKSKVGSEFRTYIKGEHGDADDPFAPPLNYSTLFISEWGRLGFNNVDYGWGPPVHVVPIQGSAVIPAGIVASLPLPAKGIRLMTWCVQEPHRPSFLHQISQLLL
ncbi:acyl transferase 4, partial [Momordica charantia]|uniref:Acyl transferase 4 n=1 Tax=Momordica charantia TaxID=3673 RepID=A0A6J1DDD7_MOMCH